MCMDEKEVINKLSLLPLDKQQEAVDFINFLYEREMKGESQPLKKRTPGLLKGKIKILPGFDDPIEGMEEYY